MAELQCPACSEAMLTLGQLNQHLDDFHSSKSSGNTGDKVAKPPHTEILSKQQKQRTHTREKSWLGIFSNKQTMERAATLESTSRHESPGQKQMVLSDVDHNAVVVDKTNQFAILRQPYTDAKSIRRDRLEKRLVRLIVGLSELDREANGLWRRQDAVKRRDFEQRKIVAWEDERAFQRCRFCGQRFGFTIRKHHCRVCGLVMCGDLERECSREVPVSVIAEKVRQPNIAHGGSCAVRICVECRDTVFGRRTFETELNSPLPPVLELSAQLRRLQTVIDSHLPEFETALASVLGDKVPDPQALAATKRTRTALLRSFSRYDALARRAREIPAATETERRIQEHVASQAAQYLQDTMMPLQALPQILGGNGDSKNPAMRRDKAERYINQLVVLEEQRFLVVRHLDEAKQKRHFDEVLPLQESAQELSREIEALRLKLDTFAPS